MKRIISVAGLFFIALAADLRADSDVTIKNLLLTGQVQGENVSFTLDITVDVQQRGARLTLTDGDLVYLEGQLPKGVTLERQGRSYDLVFESGGRWFGKPGEQHAVLTFAALAVKQDDWRSATFGIPNATIRQLAMVCDRDDLDIQFPGALQVERHKNAVGKTEAVAYLTPGSPFAVRWKPQVRKLEGELAVTCDGRTVVVAGVGALKLDTVFTYRVVQGELNTMTLDMPDQFNVTQVTGEDIREWHLENKAGGGRQIVVVLSRPKDKIYALRVEGERVLAAFPCKFDLPVVVPISVIRASGFLVIGTDSAVKLLAGKAAGLTQIDPAAYPRSAGQKEQEQRLPARTAYAYQYAHVPFQMELSAEDVVTALSVDQQTTVSYEDNAVTLQAADDIEVRDAPARDVVLETEPAWSVAQVQGANVADYDVRDLAGKREIRVYFHEAVLGHALVTVKLERTLTAGAAAFAVPRLALRDARSERGYLVLRAEKGVRLIEKKAENLREVHTASVPFRVAEAQRAYRFKSADWTLEVGVEQADAAVHAELFHLFSLGEGALYGSVSLTYRIEGAPVRKLQVRVPAACQNIEFTGRDVRGWERQGDTIVVSLQEKVLGDYTLLMTFDQPLAYEGAELAVGAIETTGTVSEVGYIALSGPASLTFDAEKTRDVSMITIAGEELPHEYALLVNDPVLKAYKYVGAPHTAHLAVRRYGTQPLLDHVADHISLRTRLSREGEAVTEATYFVKNTSQQFLSLALPAGARLWSTRVDGEPVRALDDGKGGSLIPIKRLQDANTPSRVELVYAESRPKLHWFSSLELKAPLCVAQSVFARWTLVGPERLALVPAGGDMMPPPVSEAGLKSLLEAVWAVKLGLWRALPLFMVAAGFLGVIVAVLFFRVGQGRGMSWGTAGVGVLAFVAAVTAWRALDVGDLAEGYGCAFQGRAAVTHDVAFTKAVTMSDREMSVGIRVVPAWMGGAGGFVRLVAGGLAGLGFCAFGWRARRRAAWLAAGLTLLVWGVAGKPGPIPYLAGLLVTVTGLAIMVGVWRWTYRAGRARRPGGEAFPAEPPFAQPGPGAAPGGPPVLLLAVLTGLSLAATALASGAAAVKPAQAQVEVAPHVPPGPVMRDVTMKIEAPDPARERDGIAKVELTLTFETHEATSLRVFPANYVLIDSTLKAGEGTISGDKGGYTLALRGGGTHVLTFKGYAPVTGKAGAWSLPVDLPPHLKNRIEIAIPATGWEVSSPDAAWLNVTEKDKRTLGSLVLATGRGAVIVWQPRERKTRLEQTVFYCDVQTYAVVAPGLISLTHLVQYQIAQGELQTLKFKIPDGMTVTAVAAAGLGTWRFDPETRLLEAIMEKPVSGDLTVQLVTQVPREGLPYEAELAMPSVEGATRQRGSLALAAGSAVQVRADEPKGMSVMNVGDFAPEAAQAALRNAHYSEPPEIKRAFRYHELPATARIHAETVLPELRTVEQASLDISDERLVLSSRLEVTIARAGIFDLRLALPEDFDVESLTGDEITHWDEVREGGHGVIVHFQKQTLGTRTINLVLGRMEKGVEAQITVPRVGVANAVKHVGTLAVSGERGVRFLTAQRDGVSEIHPRELGIEQPGYLAFRLLRPDWTVVLKTETLAPVVRADVLQRLDISEGMIHGHAVIQYKIDQAGVKSFRLKAPAPEVALTVSGRNVSKVNLIDKEAGLWDVELQGKVEGSQELDVTYQQSCDPQANSLKVLPLQTVGIDAQKGYTVVFTAGRLQIKANDVPAGLHEDDARNVPGSFRAGDLSDAILCYRTTRPDYALDLAVVRHASAEVLPARVEHVWLTSVLADDGQMVTRVDLKLAVGTLRFLEVTMPEGVQAWSVFVNGAAAMPLKDHGMLMIPLEAARVEGEASVELTFAGQAGTGSLFGRRSLEGPRFNVPLSDVRWDLYAPPGHRYWGFGGTLTFRASERGDGTIVFTAAQYEEVTHNAVLANNVKAEQVLRKGESLWKEGKQAQAKQALAEAVASSQGQLGLNEDARIQYRNLMRQQAVVGFYNRRAALKKSRNVWDDSEQPVAQQAAPMAQQQVEAGEWTAEYGRQVEQSLGQEDADNLNKVADKMLEQQAAAQVHANPIRVTLPVQGVHLPFYRELQITPASEIAIEFKTGSGRLLGWLSSAVSAAALLAVFWVVARLFAARRAA